jgi:alpha-L-fucosidase 2
MNSHQESEFDPSLRLWYTRPAKKWTEALPIGNGRLGAMIYGNPKQEILQLNEDTLWSGGPEDLNNPAAAAALPEIRQLLADRKFKEAEKAVQEKLNCKFQQAYLTMGSLIIKNLNSGKVREFKRILDLSTAIASMEFQQDQSQIKWEYLSSVNSQAIILRINTSHNEKQLQYSISYECPMPATQSVENYYFKYPVLRIQSQAPAYVDSYRTRTIRYEKNQGMFWESDIAIHHTDGDISTSDSMITINSASEIVIAIVAATSFNGYNKDPVKEGKDPHQLCLHTLQQLENKTYEAIREAHITEYYPYFSRVEFTLGDNSFSQIPTDKRIQRLKGNKNFIKEMVNLVKKEVFHKQEPDKLQRFQAATYNFDDLQLFVLYFQYSRYLLISSSRPGTQAANLQGIWNEHMRPPWASNYTININTQMNYWPVESCNLSECFEPLHRFVSELAENGRKTAKVHLNCNGWCANHNSNIWRQSTPVEGSPQYAFWPMAGGWLCFHLWEHFLYTQDLNYLREKAFPLMRDAALFFLDWLIPNDNGQFITSPATSPENRYYDSERQLCEVNVATTCDMAIIRQHLLNTKAAAIHLGLEKELIQRIDSTLTKLVPYQISKEGTLQEWIEDFEEVEPGHRHMSHLIGLFPGDHINLEKTPDLAKATRETIIRRIRYGGAATGWSCAWKINLFARLADSENTYRSLCTLIRDSTYPNLFDAHPPFQIDGNFGAISGIAELFVQSQNNQLKLLPALPSEWQSGSISGLRIRGNATIDIEWDKHRLIQAVLHAHSAVPLKIISKEPILIIDTNGKEVQITEDNGQYSALTEPEKSYIIKLKPLNRNHSY